MNSIDEAQKKLKSKIKIFRKNRQKRKLNYRNLVVVKPSSNVFQALSLPKVLNLNPRSIYNRRIGFDLHVKELGTRGTTT